VGLLLVLVGAAAAAMTPGLRGLLSSL